jgi:hypothetical protein
MPQHQPITKASGTKGFARLRHGLLAVAAGVLAWGALAAGAQAQQPIIAKGNAIITGFSGTVAAKDATETADPIDNLFIDLNGASMRLQDISAGGQPPQGQLIASPTTFQAKAGDVGQVFGIAMDDGRGPEGNLSATPDIYLSASSAFGLQIVQKDGSGKLSRMRTGNPGAQWMPGQWGDATKGGTPGSIWKVNGTTGAITIFANVELAGQPNSGPGLGNLTFHAKSRQMFVSDLSTGMIHRLDMRGTDLGYFDHGVQGRAAAGLAPVPDDAGNRLDISNPLFNSDDAASWHFAQKGRMVWGVRANGDRLYYSVAEGPQVWSISIGEDGSFGNDPRLEIDVTGTPNNNAISDIAFDGQGYIYLAQRGAARGDYAYKVFAEGKKSALLRYRQDPVSLKWLAAPEEYAVGFPPEHRNTNGGVALGYAYDDQGRILPGSCGRMVWTTGEMLRLGAGVPGPEVVHGLQGMDRALVRPANVPPNRTYFTDYDGTYNDADVQGHMGNVKIWQPCEQAAFVPKPGVPSYYVPSPPGTFNLTLTKYADPTDCVAGGQGWLCSYRVFVENTGSTIYYGAVRVADVLPAQPAGAIMTFAPQPTWFCSQVGPSAHECINPQVLLYPGQYTELDVIVDTPRAYLDCYLENYAEILWPQGYGDANPRDDFDAASARIPTSLCAPSKDKKTNLKIRKLGERHCTLDGKGINPGWDCGFAVIVTNMGPAVYSDRIEFNDTIPAGASASFVSADPWTCAGGPPNYLCKLPPTTLTPGQSTVVYAKVRVPLSYPRQGKCQVTNRVHITYAPGGSDENTNPGDDDASADVTVPDGECVGQKTNLRIDKVPYDACQRSALNGVAGQACPFFVLVTNTGPGNYSGPIQVDDVFGPSVTFSVGGSAVSGTPPWTCTNSTVIGSCQDPSAVLTPGDSSGFLAIGFTPDSVIANGQCTMTNTATIVTATPGTLHNSTIGDDTATATQTFTDPRCSKTPIQPVVQPQILPGKPSHVMIEKTCKPGSAGLACRITITNDGGAPLQDPISFADQGSWTDNGQPLQIASASPSSPAILCSGLPSNLVCNLPGSALPPGASLSVDVVIGGGTGSTTYRNCATLVQPNRKPIAVIGTPSCAEGGMGSPISVKKTAPAACAYGKDCAFQITLTNDGDQSYSGTLMVGDVLKLGGVASNGAAITSISPPLNCATQPSALPFTCKVAASLAGHEAHTHTIVVHMPAAPANGGAADGLNCFVAVDALGASAGNGAAAIGGPGTGPGYSCVGFKMEQPDTCPGQLKRTGTQCKCPDGTRQGANYTCKGGTDIPLPPLPPAKKYCQAPLVGTYPDCACPEGRPVYKGGQCVPKTPVVQCDLPRVLYKNECVCPASRPNFKSGQCLPDVPVVRCEAPRQLYHNECVCPASRPNFKNGQCLPDQVKRCIAPEVGNYPDCYLPKCKNGMIGQYPDCRPATAPDCRAPYLGKVGSCYCPKGMFDTGKTCIDIVIPKCPPGTVGVFSACKPKGPAPGQCQPGEYKVDGVHCCPRGYGWDGKCYPPSNGGNTKPGKLIPDIIQKLIIPNLKIQKPQAPQQPNCRRGMYWNGQACVYSDATQPGTLNSPILKKQLNPNLQIFKQLVPQLQIN